MQRAPTSPRWPGQFLLLSLLLALTSCGPKAPGTAGGNRSDPGPQPSPEPPATAATGKAGRRTENPASSGQPIQFSGAANAHQLLLPGRELPSGLPGHRRGSGGSPAPIDISAVLAMQPTDASRPRGEDRRKDTPANFQATVSEVNGTVEMLEAGSEVWRSIDVGAPFPAGATLRTDGEGSAKVTLDGNNSIMTLTSNTSLRLDSLDPKRGGGVNARLTVISGEVAGVFSSLNGDSRFEVVMPDGERVVYSPPRDSQLVFDSVGPRHPAHPAPAPSYNSYWPRDNANINPDASQRLALGFVDGIPEPPPLALLALGAIVVALGARRPGADRSD